MKPKAAEVADKSPPRLGALVVERKPALASLVTERIREAIMFGELSLGEAVSEDRLATMLGVSRTPVREALSILEQEGFVRTVPRRGIFIVRKSKREMIEMIQMWAALESMAARLATLTASDAEIGKLRHLFDSFQSSPPAEHLDEYSDANIAFHQAIIRLGGSRLIEDATHNLFLHVRAIRRATISQNNRAARSIIEHLKIIEALERRDTELAERLTRQHTLDLAAHVDRYCDFLD
jgi:DNA-binding GntR family transcriptional regulator